MMTKVLFQRDGSRRCCLIDAPLGGMPVDLAEAWSVWLTHHGVDPKDVLVGCPIVCDDLALSIEWTALARDAGGRALLTEDRAEVLRETHAAWLDKPASAMPDEPELGK